MHHVLAGWFKSLISGHFHLRAEFPESAAPAHSPTHADTMLQDVLDLGPARLFGLARLLLSVQVLVGMVGCLAFVYGTM